MNFPGLVKKGFNALQNAADNKSLTRGIIGDKATDFLESHTLEARRKKKEASVIQDFSPPKTPEASAGHMSILNKVAPKLAGNLANASPEEQASVSRNILKKMVEEDPDSLFHTLGVNKIKDHFRNLTDDLSDSFKGGF